jgi:DNA-binding CsgD family transcriptional regulator
VSGAEPSGYRELLTFVAELHQCRRLDDLERRLTTHASQVIPTDLVSLNKIDLSGDLGGSRAIFFPPLASPDSISKAFDQYMHQHPLVEEFRRTGDGAPRRMSDFIDMGDFQRLELYEHVFKPLQSLHQIAFSIVSIPGMVIGLGLNRTHDDFTDEDLALSRLMYEQLPATFHHVQLTEIHELEALPSEDLGLSDREREILILLRAGLSNQSIADAMHLAKRTVDKHLERLYRKLDVRSRTAAVHRVWPPSP